MMITRDNCHQFSIKTYVVTTHKNIGFQVEIGKTYLLILSTYESHHEETCILHICKNKDTDQLRSDCAADQCLCFRYIDSTIPLLSKSEFSKPLTIFSGCIARFVSELVRNPEDNFSNEAAHVCTSA